MNVKGNINKEELMSAEEDDDDVECVSSTTHNITFVPYQLLNLWPLRCRQCHQTSTFQTLFVVESCNVIKLYDTGPGIVNASALEVPAGTPMGW